MHDKALVFRETLEQLRFVLAFEKRDLPKRVVSACLVTVFVYILSSPLAAMICFGSMCASEMILRLMAALTPSTEDKIRRAHIWMVTVFHFLATAGYCVPMFFLVLSERTTGGLLCCLWMGGVTLHVIGIHSLIRVFNWSMLIPPVCAIFAVVYIASSATYSSAVPGDGWMLAIGSAMFVLNLIDVLRTQRDTRRMFSMARLDARARLKQLEYLSQHDVLTGLLNRAAFEERGQCALEQVEPGLHVGVMQIDLNGFKPINDAYGHTTGDVVLRRVAEALCKALPKACVARLGGDEFGVLVPSVRDQSALMEMAVMAQAAINQPICHAGRKLSVGAAIGLSLTERGRWRPTVGELRAEADQAMYVAKADQTALPRPVAYDRHTFPNRPTLEDKAELVAALEAGDLRPSFQPIVRLRTGRVAGFEALARWHLPDGRVKPPAQFLSAVKQFGLEYDFTLHMIRAALAQIQSFRARGITPPRISVNIMESVFATQSGIASIETLLREDVRASAYLDFELTEDIVIQRHAERIRETVRRISKFGVRFFLDDFGTGYASFKHLRSLPIDVLKIDKSLVSTLGEDEVSEALIEGFLVIARGVGAAVVAEGVETALQAEKLREMGCAYAQGYYFGHAMNTDELLGYDLGPSVPGREQVPQVVLGNTAVAGD